jgi:hypothetical protein
VLKGEAAYNEADVESLDLMPDPASTRRPGWDAVGERVPRLETHKPAFVARPEAWAVLHKRDTKWKAKGFDEASQALFPARTKADLAIRRTRLFDYYRHLRRLGREGDFWYMLMRFGDGSDIVLVTLVVEVACLFGMDWFQRWESLGAFWGTVDHYVEVTKTVSDIIKVTGLDERILDWPLYVENHVLAGYRHLPFGDWDMIEQAARLAGAGEEHNYLGLTWEEVMEEALPMHSADVDALSFADYVRGGGWITSGSSSVGRFEVVLDDGGKVKSVKCRKNGVLDFVDVEELITEALRRDWAENAALVKNETGKVRLAVAGDIYTYLKMAWLTTFIPKATADWVGNTLDENFYQQTKRMDEMLRLLDEYEFELPWDFKEFDHQPKHRETKGIATHMYRGGRMNAPPKLHAEYDMVRDNVLRCLDNNRLTVRDPATGRTAQFKVVGGVSSGMEITSKLGNGWNGCITTLVKRAVVLMELDEAAWRKFIRGDDSSNYSKTWVAAAALKLGYDVVGAIGGVGKFAIRRRETEFLRVWYQRSGLVGYPSRSAVGVVQRKPWSNTPYEPAAVLKDIYDALNTTRRRVYKFGRAQEVDKVWETLRGVWCQLHALPLAVVWIPREAGGLGIEPPPDSQVGKVTPAVEAIRRKGFRIEGMNDSRALALVERIRKTYGVELSMERATQVAYEQIVETVVSDDVPLVAKTLRDEWRKDLLYRKRVVEVHRANRTTQVKTRLGTLTAANLEVVSAALKVGAPMFGRYRHIEQLKEDYRVIDPQVGFRAWLRRVDPEIEEAVGQFHRSWHVSERLDYLSGKLLLRPRLVNPQLVGILALAVANEVTPARPNKDWRTLSVGAALEWELFVSPLSQMLYMW